MSNVTNVKKTTYKGVKVIDGGRETIYPYEEYLDIMAMQYGFDDYKDLVKHGYHIDIPEESLVAM